MSATAGKRERNKAQNRAQILAAARDVFAEIGYGAATIRDVIRRTDLASGTFYNYFPDKEAVLRAIAEQDAADMRARIREGRARATTPEEFIANGFRACFASFADDPAYIDLMRTNAGAFRTLLDEPALGAGVQELLDDLRDAVAAGDLPPFDVDYMTAAMVGCAFEVGIRLIEHDPPDIEGATGFATDLFLGGMQRMAAERAARSQPGPPAAPA